MNEQQKNNANQNSSRSISLDDIYNEPEKLSEIVWQTIKDSERNCRGLSTSAQIHSYDDPVAIEWGGRGAEGTVLYIPTTVAYRVILKGIEIGMRIAKEQQHDKADRDGIQRV